MPVNQDETAQPCVQGQPGAKPRDTVSQNQTHPKFQEFGKSNCPFILGTRDQTQGRENNIKRVCYCLNMEPHHYHHCQKACVWNLSSQLVAPFWKTVEEERPSWGKWATGKLSLEDYRLVPCHFWPPDVVFQLPLSPRTQPFLLWQTTYPEPTQTSPLSCLCQVFIWS